MQTHREFTATAASGGQTVHIGNGVRTTKLAKAERRSIMRALGRKNTGRQWRKTRKELRRIRREVIAASRRKVFGSKGSQS